MDNAFWIQHLAEYEHIRHCKHENTTVEYRGMMQMVDGEPTDNIYWVVVCRDCGAILESEREGQDDIPF